MKTQEEKALDFVKSLLDPERNGHSVNCYIRDEARKILGIEPVEFNYKPIYQHELERVYKWLKEKGYHICYEDDSGGTFSQVYLPMSKKHLFKLLYKENE